MKNLFYFYVIFAVALAAHSQVIWTTTITNFFSLAGDSVNFTASGRNMATTNSPVTLAVALDCGIIYTSTPSAGNGTAWSLTGTMQWDGTNLNFSAQFDCGDPANPQVAQFGTLTNFIVGTNTFTLTIYGNTNGLTLNTASLDAFRAPQPTPPPIQGATIIIGGVSKYTSGGSDAVTNATLTQLNTASNAIISWISTQQFGSASNLTGFFTTNMVLNNTSNQYVAVTGLGYTPRFCEVTFLCVTNDAGSMSQVGDEVSFASVSAGATFNGGLMSWVKNSTNIIILTDFPFVGNEAVFEWNRKISGDVASPYNMKDFVLKIVAF